MIKFELESAVSAAYEIAARAQYRRAVQAVAESIADMREMPGLYEENDIETYKHGAVLGLLWMVDGLAGSQIEHDINLAIATIESDATD